MTGPRSLDSYLDSDDGLKRLLARAHALLDLERSVLRILETGLASNCRVVNVRDGMLTLAATSGAWATRLRYESSRLLGALQQSGYQSIRSIHISIKPDTSAQSVRRRPQRPSYEAADAILSAADCIEDPGLRDALSRLARHRRSAGR